MDETPQGAVALSPADLSGLAAIVVADEGDQSVIGRPDLGSFVAVPAAGGELIRTLVATGDLGAASAAASAVAGQDVDGADFVRQLGAMGLLAAPADRPSRDAAGGGGVAASTVVRALFGRVAWTVYAVAAAGSFVAMVLDPSLRPSYEDVWFTEDKAFSTLVVTVLAVLLTGLHEMWHWLSGRALGIGAGFRVSRRGVFLVFETDLTEAVTLPRAKRNGIYLAGMAVDSVVLALALLTQRWVAAEPGAVPPVVGHLAAAVALLMVVGIIQQWALVFLRSDVYALLANLLRCHNLYRATWLTTKRRVGALSGDEVDELARISEHDRDVARWFGWVYLVGIVAITAMVVFWVVPYLVGMVRWLGPVIARAEVGSGQFWTALALLALTAFTWLTPAFIAVRERRLRLAGRLL